MGVGCDSFVIAGARNATKLPLSVTDGINAVSNFE